MNRRNLLKTAAAALVAPVMPAAANTITPKIGTTRWFPPELPPHPDKRVWAYMEISRDQDRMEFLTQVAHARAMIRNRPEWLSGPVPEPFLRSFEELVKTPWRDDDSELNDACLEADYEQTLLASGLDYARGMAEKDEREREEKAALEAAAQSAKEARERIPKKTEEEIARRSAELYCGFIEDTIKNWPHVFTEAHVERLTKIVMSIKPA